jgi:6-phosphogluconolactonase/glucosamine-6-phosphate isomerase/deaminase
MTKEEICHIVNEEEKEHFKKKVLEKEAQIDPSINAFFAEMSKSVSWFWTTEITLNGVP